MLRVCLLGSKAIVRIVDRLGDCIILKQIGPRLYSMAEESATKKSKIMKKIGTHNGTFHCDEVLACCLLKHLDEYKDAEIVRSRDQSILDTCDIVVDVGGVYDPQKNRFDHHQRSFSESINTILPQKKWTTKLSSAGLIYTHFGKKVLSKLMGTTEKDEITEVIFDKVYEFFIEEIDAIDNGINQADNLKYHITTNLSSRVSYLNPSWNEPDTDSDNCFKKAMELVGAEFLDRVMFYKKSWLPAREIVEQAIDDRAKVHSSGEIICFENGGCPWKDHLFAIEEEKNIVPKIKYVLFPDQNKKWRIQCVPLKLGSFENRLSILKDWQGLRDDALSEKSGIPGCIFVHANGFIGGNITFDGVLEMATECLKQSG